MHSNRHETLLQHMARKLFYTQLPTIKMGFGTKITKTKPDFMNSDFTHFKQVIATARFRLSSIGVLFIFKHSQHNNIRYF